MTQPTSPAPGFVRRKPSYLQPHQTGEPSEDVDVQAADAVVGQISVGNRRDGMNDHRRQTGRA